MCGDIRLETQVVLTDGNIASSYGWELRLYLWKGT